MVLHGSGITDTAPKRSRHTVLHARGTLSDHGQPATATGVNAASGPDLAELLLQLQRHARPGSRVFLISDLSDALSDAALQSAAQLARKSQLVAMHVSDPLERQLPRAGRYSATDGTSIASLDTTDRSLRDGYARDYKDKLDHLTGRYRGFRIPLLKLSTDQSPLPSLQKYFPNR